MQATHLTVALGMDHTRLLLHTAECARTQHTASTVTVLTLSNLSSDHTTATTYSHLLTVVTDTTIVATDPCGLCLVEAHQQEASTELGSTTTPDTCTGHLLTTVVLLHLLLPTCAITILEPCCLTALTLMTGRHLTS